MVFAANFTDAVLNGSLFDGTSTESFMCNLVLNNIIEFEFNT